MAFAGVSVITNGGLLVGSTSPSFDARAARGYHLLVVQDRPAPSNPTITVAAMSNPFTVGGRNWKIAYTHVHNHRDIAFVTVLLLLDDQNQLAVPDPANLVKNFF